MDTEKGVKTQKNNPITSKPLVRKNISLTVAARKS